jgi:hypothetical protein
MTHVAALEATLLEQDLSFVHLAPDAPRVARALRQLEHVLLSQGLGITIRDQVVHAHRSRGIFLIGSIARIMADGERVSALILEDSLEMGHKVVKECLLIPVRMGNVEPLVIYTGSRAEGYRY